MVTKTISQPQASTATPAAFGTNLDVLTLLTLREIEAAGSLSGLEAVNAVASTAGLLGIAPPGYALLHELVDNGVVRSSPGTQRRYQVTEAGKREAECLARRCWPRIPGSRGQLEQATRARLATVLV